MAGKNATLKKESAIESSEKEIVENKPTEVKSSEVLSGEYQSLGLEFSDDDEDIEDGAGGYAPMVELDEENVERIPNNNMESKGTEGKKEVEKSKDAHSGTDDLTPEKIKEIQKVMSEIKLPAPEWAKRVPEEVWMKRLHDQLSEDLK
eukprot:CAMPEP_0167764776 /NCGR_PEP_ID=MMETSP0110_2-20121227/14256_1 /TAXON_ID=629695 /ORGANISM="Gymnochlora sp., Strain CCMP2014" /LENGTH=147 /DNA_ID=CAMNT_0007652289 /DNA_START=156 /DNA_END=599 /DNA_ORIENTATION=+